LCVTQFVTSSAAAFEVPMWLRNDEIMKISY